MAEVMGSSTAAIPNGRSSPPIAESARESLVHEEDKGSDCSLLEYWRDYLSGCTPTHFPHIASVSSLYDSGQCKSVDVQLPKALGTDSSLAECGITDSSILCLAWALTLRAFTGLDSVCFGCEDLGPQPAAPSNSGCNFNERICRIDLDDNIKIHEILENVRDDFRSGPPLSNGALGDLLGYVDLVETKICNTKVSLLRATGQERNGNTNRRTSDNAHTHEYDVEVEYRVQDGQASIGLRYRVHVLSHEQALGVAHTVVQAIASVLEQAPASTIGQVRLLCERDKRQVFAWNEHPPRQDSRCVYEPIRDRCRTQANAPAVSAWDGDFDYKRLDSLSSTLAVHLSGLGVGPEVFVPLCFEKSRWIVVAMLAVVKAGGAFVLLDPSHPLRRLQSICQTASAPVVVASRRNSALAADLADHTVVVGDGEKALHHAASNWIPSNVAPYHALYATFTSGSTGTPKGVVVEHGTFLSTVTPYSQAVGLSKDTRAFQFSSFAFDVAIFDTLITLINGGCLCVPSNSDRWSDVPKAIGQFKANHASLTPSVARILQPADLPTLKTVVLGGEKLAASDVDQWVGHVRLVSLYGASECPLMSLQSYTRDESRLCHTSHPTGGLSWLVDPSCLEELAPIGSVGELLIEGPVVGRGYLNDPERTDLAFIRPPDWLRQLRGGQCCKRVYKSGDLVQYQADGSLRYVGRKDSQVKLRGQRVELGEVEHNVRQCFADAQGVVAEVVTSAYFGQDPMLVAFIDYDKRPGQSSNHSSHATIDNILEEPLQWFSSAVSQARAQLHSSVPSYMVPAIFLPLTRIPLTTTGKADRRRLRQLATTLSRGTIESFGRSKNPKQGPVTEAEKALQRYFAQVLNLPVEQVAADDHLFHRGGNSITVMKLVAVAREGSHRITVQDVFDCATLSVLASKMESVESVEEDITTPFSLMGDENIQSVIQSVTNQCQIPIEAVEDIYPCTPLQEGLMALTEQDLGASFIADVEYEISSHVTLQQLESCWNAVAQANPILRTRLILSDRHGILQTVVRGRLQWTASTDGDIGNFQGGIGTRLVRFVVYRSKGGWKLVVSIHHAIYDGWSLSLLLAEVEKAFEGRNLTPRSFGPFIRHIKSITGHQDYWQSSMAGLESPTFPTLPSASYQVTPNAVTEIRKAVGVPTTRDFTQNSYVKLAWAITQSRLQGCNDIFYGVVVSGRNAPIAGIEALTAPTVSTVPCRVTLDTRATLRNCLQKIQEESLAVIPFEHTGLQYIRRFGPSAARACSFQTLLVIQPAGEPPSCSLLKPVVSVVDHQNTATYAITIYCTLEGGSLSVTAVYDSSVVTDAKMQHMLSDFVNALRGIHSQPNLLIRDIMDLGNARTDNERKSATSRPLFRQAKADEVGTFAFPPLPSATYRPSQNASAFQCIKIQEGRATDIILLAAWGILQARYADSGESVFAYACDKRPPVPVMIEAQWECPARQYLDDVRRQYAGANTQPADNVSKELNNEISTGSNSFQTLLVIRQDTPVEAVQISSSMETALTLVLTIKSSNVNISASFDGNLLSCPQVIRMVQQFEHLVSQLVGELPPTLSDFELVSPKDKSDLALWNQCSGDGIESTIHSLILEQVNTSPGSQAICSWDGQMTYQELDDISSRLAGYLRDVGVAAEVLVPLCFEKSMWMIVAMLAVLKAGGAFVPIDADTPQSRLRTIIEEVQPPVILGSSDLHERYFALAPVTIIAGPGLNSLISAQATQHPPTVTSANAAYVIFTSGSTGTPKGVVIEHRAFCTASLAFKDVLRVKGRVLQFASYAFDVSMLEILSTLIYGGCICVPSETDRRGNIAAVINDMEVTWAMLTPSFANTIDPAAIPNLETLCLAGEPMTSVHVDTWASRLDLLNAYGPAECSVICVATRTPFTVGCVQPSIGTAVGGGVSWVVDADNYHRLAPVGAIGELLIEGPILARGYLNQPERTAASFVAHPNWFQSRHGARLYRTGDLVRYLPDGSLAYVGRKDNQVKIRGQRVELGEIEHQVVSVSGNEVSQALVSYPRLGVFANKVTAILQPGQSHHDSAMLAPITDARLESMGFNMVQFAQQVCEVLPAHMVPAVWIVVERLPTLPSAKLDRKAVDGWLAALPSDFQPSLRDGDNSMGTLPALGTNEEAALAISNRIAALASGGDAAREARLAGREFNVASTGLDSIQVLHLVSFLKQMYDTVVPVRRILDGKTTVRSLATLTSGSTSSTNDPDSVDLMQEVSRLVRTIPQGPNPATQSGRAVFITGVTGFLGTQILRQVCAARDVDHVIVHVRASSPESGFSRCKEAAMRARWWSESYANKIRVWAGDLALPRLGLTAEQWARLTGEKPGDCIINAIIHAGAAVNWNAGYDILRAANADSTADLVRAVVMNPCHPRLVYISGGHMWDTYEDDVSLAHQLSSGSGYGQSKFVAEMVVKHFAAQSPRRGQFSIIKPGLIIGTPEEGISNADDYFWRLTASAIDIQSCPASGDTARLTITSSARVAEVAIHNALGASSDTESISYMTDGLPVSELWSLLRDELGYPIVALSQDAWVSKMQQSIKDRGDNHPLWAVKEVFDETHGKFGSELRAGTMTGRGNEHVRAALRRSIEFLRDVGFLADAAGSRSVYAANKAFQRTGNVWGLCQSPHGH